MKLTAVYVNVFVFYILSFMIAVHKIFIILAIKRESWLY